MRQQWIPYLLALSAVLFLTPGTPARKAEGNEDNNPVFTTIDFPGARITSGRDVTADVDAYVGEIDDVRGHHGFLLKSGTFTAIDFPGASSTDAHGINSRGDIVGVYRTGGVGATDGESHAYLLNKDGFTSFDAENATGTSFNGINDRGDIVGGWCDGTVTPCPLAGEGHRGFVLSDGQFTSMDFPGATLTQAWKINSRGEVVGVYTDAAGNSHGFLWRAGEFESIDFPGAVGTLAFGINNRGDIVGNYCFALPCGVGLVNNHGFVLRRGEFTSFDFPGALFTRAFAINARGDIAGSYRDLALRNHAFLIDKGADDEGDDDGN